MKKIVKQLFFLSLLVVLFASCKKDENKVFFEGGTNPVLKASTTSDMVLTGANKDNEAIKFTWTNPDYKFTTGISSQDVTYVLQIDTTGSNFTNPNIQEVSIAKDLGVSFTVQAFNTFFNKMGLKYGQPHNIEFRVKAALANGIAVPSYSNVIKIIITPYLDVAVPIPTNGTLWAIGNAFASGWDNPMLSPYNDTQKFTKVSETLYELEVNFVGGGNFKLIQIQGDWNSQYRPKYSSSVPFDAGDFEKVNADPGWNGPAAAGKYKITINFITGKYKVEKV